MWGTECEEAQRQEDAKTFGSTVKSPVWLSLDMVGVGELQDKPELGVPPLVTSHFLTAQNTAGPLLSPESFWLLSESSLLVSQSLGVTTSPA